MPGVNHYENFPVASWLCPRRLRAPIVALYRFARTADDLADEGDATPQQRLADLQAYREALQGIYQPGPSAQTLASTRWSEIFEPLALQVRTHHLPAHLLHALLDAFEQDVRYTASAHRYADEAELLDYCTRSANPVGRLLLHLYNVSDDASLKQSDAICSALQLINFWQDLSIDLPRQRCYLPQDALKRHGVELDTLQANRANPAAQAMVLELAARARRLMRDGTPLPQRLPGRLGWELRLVVQGGLRILDKIDTLQGKTWAMRPKLTGRDLPVLFWRALCPAPTFRASQA